MREAGKDTAIIPVQVEALAEGRFLAICDAIQGCHAEGDTIAEALDIIEDVARILVELQLEKGLPLDPIFDRVRHPAVIKARLVEE